jgi:hypothetical protein
MLKRVFLLLAICMSLSAMENSQERPSLTVTKCLEKWGDELHKYCFFDYFVDGRKGKTLNLEGCNLGSLEGMDRVEWKEATTLFLGGNQVREISPDILKNFTKLRDLYIGLNPITYLSAEVVKNLPALEQVDISKINIREENIDQLFAACAGRKVTFIMRYWTLEQWVQEIRASDDRTFQRLQARRISLAKSALEAQLKELEKEEEEEPSA